jgi:hypothetical protein
VDPWLARRLRSLCVRQLTVNLIFKQWTRPSFWLFPRNAPAPSENAWHRSLITQANVAALYRSQPWDVLAQVVTPRSFERSGRFQHFTRMYLALEADLRQAFWEATHKLPITQEMRDNHRFWKILWLGRKQRRSRAGPRFKTFAPIVVAIHHVKTLRRFTAAARAARSIRSAPPRTPGTGSARSTCGSAASRQSLAVGPWLP